MTDTERLGQIEWFQDLRAAIESDDKESALQAIDAAIEMYKREAPTQE